MDKYCRIFSNSRAFNQITFLSMHTDKDRDNKPWRNHPLRLRWCCVQYHMLFTLPGHARRAHLTSKHSPCSFAAIQYISTLLSYIGQHTYTTRNDTLLVGLMDCTHTCMMRDEIKCPFSNFNCCNVEVWERMRNWISHFSGQVIT